MKFDVYCDQANPNVPTSANPRAGRHMMAARKKPRPLIRYAGSAAETSITSKPIGSELDARAYTERPARQAGQALAQTPDYLPALHQAAEPRAGRIAATLRPGVVFSLAGSRPPSPGRLPESSSDNLCPIGNSRAIENERYVGACFIHQNVLSTTDGAPWTVAAQANLSNSRTHP